MIKFNVDVKPDENATETINGKYNVKCITESENNTIIECINKTMQNFTSDCYALGLMFESNSIIYKPRYVLMQLVIEYAEHSENPLDMLGCAIAYSNKSARFRQQAMEWAEKFLSVSSTIPKRNGYEIFSKKQVYTIICDGYEYIGAYAKAINAIDLCYENCTEDIWYIEKKASLLSKINVNQAVQYLSDVISKNNAQEYVNKLLTEYTSKAERKYTFRARKKTTTDEDIQFEEDVRRLAKRYLIEI